MSDAAAERKSIVVKAEIQLEARPGDALLNSRELQLFDLFRQLKKPINVEKFPGSIVVRTYRKGAVVCRQGETGFSAFYVPTAADMERWNAHAANAEIPEEVDSMFPPAPILTARILQGTTAARRRGFWKSLIFGTGEIHSESIVAIPNDGPTDINPNTRSAALMEGDVFGEMSCMTFAPRSATVIADQDCWLVEFNRNIFDQLQKDQKYREWMDAIYVDRVLDSHLRRLEIFSGLTNDQLAQIRGAVTLDVVDPGAVICEQGEVPNGKPLDVLVVRSGVVQVVQDAGISLRRHEIDWSGLCQQLNDGADSFLSESTESTARGSATGKSSTAGILEAARKKPVPQGLTSGGKPSTADILSAARKKKPSTADILEAARKKTGDGSDSPSPSPEEMSTADKFAAARPTSVDSGTETEETPSVGQSTPSRPGTPPKPVGKPSTADILAAARGKPASAAPRGNPSPKEVTEAAPTEGDSGSSDARKQDGEPSPPAPDTSAEPESLTDEDRSRSSDTAPKRPPEYVRSKASAASASLEGAVYSHLSEAVQESVHALARGTAHQSLHQDIVFESFRQLTRSRGFLQDSQVQPLFSRPNVARRIATFPKGLKGIQKEWTDMEIRVAGRAVLSEIFPDAIPAPAETTRAPRVLSYLSRGDCFGELAVVRNEPRSASCIAYDHPADGSGRKSGRVELVRIAGDVFQRLMEESPALSARVHQMAEGYHTDDSPEGSEPGAAELFSSTEFQDLGLFQGTELFLIDLDACTRCGECVDACVATHDDGFSRLYLDGPRFGRFLIPSACRSCLNPACMIGCPVGSITRGVNGQIEIHDWCIGCGLCAQQCPYDSIQMHDLGLIPEHAIGWQFRRRSLVGEGDNWTCSSGGSGDWVAGNSPVRWTAEVRSAAGFDRSEINESVCFRYEFANTAAKSTSQFRLLVSSPAGELNVWLNGTGVPMSQSPPQQKRGEWEATIEAHSLKVSKNVLAVELKVETAIAEQSVLLSARLDAVPKAGEKTASVLESEFQATLELVTERAVVCDLCSSLPGQQPACVTSCPHTAAMRVNPLVSFPS